MDSVTPRQWPGHLFSGVDLPYGNAITAGLSGQPVSLRGTDHPAYAFDVIGAWRANMPGAAPAADAGTTAAADASAGNVPLVPDWLERVIEKLQWAAGGILLAIVLVAIGAVTFIKD